MQFINLDKEIISEEKIINLVGINLEDNIDYINEIEGVKTIGTIELSGTYQTENGSKSFHETIVIDMFSDFASIEDRMKLEVKIEDFDYVINENKITINVKLRISGLKEIDTTFLAPEDSKIIEEEINKEDELPLKEPNDIYIPSIGVDDVNINRDKKEEDLLIKEGQPKKSLIEKIFSNKRIKEEVSWKLHVVKYESSYEEIASKYNVSVEKLKTINNNDSLGEGKLIFIPLTKYESND